LVIYFSTHSLSFPSLEIKDHSSTRPHICLNSQALLVPKLSNGTINNMSIAKREKSRKAPKNISP